MNDPLDVAAEGAVRAERRRTGLLLGVATGGFFLLVAAWYLFPDVFARTIAGTPVTLAMAGAFVDLVVIMGALAWFARRQAHAEAVRLVGDEEARRGGAAADPRMDGRR